MGPMNYHQRGNTSSNTDATSYATSSIAPTAGRVAFVAALSRRVAGEPTTPTLSGQSLTWVAVGNIYVAPIKLTVFRAYVTGASTGAVTVDYAGQTQDAQCILYVEVTNPLSSAPVAQFKTGSAATNTTLTTTFDNAFGSQFNTVMAFLGTDISSGITVTNSTDGIFAMGTTSATDGLRIQAAMSPANLSAVTFTSASADLVALISEVANGLPTAIPTGSYEISGNVKRGGVNQSGATVRVIDRTRALISSTTTDGSGNYAVSVDSNTADQFAAYVEYENGGTEYQDMAPWAITAVTP